MTCGSVGVIFANTSENYCSSVSSLIKLNNILSPMVQEQNIVEHIRLSFSFLSFDPVKKLVVFGCPWFVK